MLTNKAIAEKDYRTAMKGIEWVLAKRFPKKYGKNSDANININAITQTNVISMQEILSMIPVEIKRQILAKMRENKDTTLAN